jgi:LuxR family maltose regulon positive regulatory protein
LQAVALQAQGNNAQAVITLKRALVLAEPEGYMRAFLAWGLPMLTLLRQVSSHSLVEDYVNKLLKAFGAYATPSTLLEPLTERELDILRLLAAGMSNREIAASLVITLGTVKWYVNSIYGKLNVNSRVQAVARAKELRLLS